MLARLKQYLMLGNRRVMLFMAYTVAYHIGLLGIFDVVLNFYYVSLGYDIGTIAMFQSLPRLGGFLTSIPMGMLTNRIGTYRMMIYASVGVSLSMAAMVFFPTLLMLAISRFMLGFMYGAQQLAQSPMMGAIVDRSSHTRFFAYHNVVSMGSMAVGSFIGGYMPALTILLFAPFVPAAYVANAQTTFAYGGALIVASVVVLIGIIPFWFVGDIHASADDTDSHLKLKRKRGEGTPWRLLTILNLPLLLFGFTGGLTFPFYNLFFRTQFGVPDETVGTILSIGWLGMALVPLANPALERRFGRIGTLAITLTIGALGFVGLAAAPTLALSVVAFVIAISFRNVMQTLFQPLLMATLPVEFHNNCSSMGLVMWNVGWMIATAISGILQTAIGFRTIMDIVAVGVLMTAGLIVVIFRQQMAFSRR
jgi:MFS family permease